MFVEWTKNNEFTTVSATSGDLTQAHLDHLKKPGYFGRGESRKLAVEAKSLKVDLLRDKESIREFFVALANHDDDGVFKNKAIKMIIRHFWKRMRSVLLKKVLLPYTLGFAMFNIYFAFCL